MKQMNKSNRERRKEQVVWVQLLQNNLRRLNSQIEKQGEAIQQLFKSEVQARHEFESHKERGLAQENRLRQEIESMKASLQSLIERNQEVNFANFERIQQLIDEQESTMVEKQNSMQQFANCLEQILMTLKESDLVEIVPYSSLVVITPFDDALFKCTPGRDDYSKSEYQVIARNKRNDDRLISSKGQLRGPPAEVSEQHQLRGIKPKQRLVA